MRVVSIALAPVALALPFLWLQEARHALHALLPTSVLAPLRLDWRVHQLQPSANAGVKSWWKDGRQFVQRGQNIYERIISPNAQLADYAIRFKTQHGHALDNPSFCDPDVKQHTGYLDISNDRHLFFWFFEARTNSNSAPLMLWINGGPGCSSSLGLLFEHGPCKISAGGANTTRNEWSWNRNMNIIYLDQPVGVGYSYRSGGGAVSSTPVAALDVWAFLQLFLARFEQYADTPFHLAAESYGGTFAPHIASVIHKQNLNASPGSGIVYIPLTSVVLANGITEPRTQMAAVPDFACDGPFPIYEPDGKECKNLRSAASTCERLIQSCYDLGSRFVCAPTGLYCWNQLFSGFNKLGLNRYDVREKCDFSKTPLCYSEMEDIDVWLNRTDVKRAVGAEEGITFQSCNTDVIFAFHSRGDAMHNAASVLPELLQAGIRLLVYAGIADFMCNFIGNERWMERLAGHPFETEFAFASKKDWRTAASGRLAGKVRSAGSGGGGAGNFTYVEVHDAGHMVPFNQPEAALDLIERWVFASPLAE